MKLQFMAGAFAAAMLAAGCARGQLDKEDHAAGPWAFTYFKSNGETGLHLACSEDGLNWEELNGGRPVFNAQVGSTKLMRDPCAIVGPDGQTFWTREAGTAPPMSLSLKEGQTIDQAVAEYMKPSGWIFENTNFPPRVSKSKSGTFGTTELTSSGPRNATATPPAR